MATRMLQRRGTAAEWAAQNPVVGNGEIGFETDTKVIKLGDGVTAWNDLTVPYLHKSGGTMTGALILNGAPSAANQAATKAYADQKISRLGDSMDGSLSVQTPVSAAHAARKDYVDNARSWVNLGFTDVLLGSDTYMTLSWPNGAYYRAFEVFVTAGVSLGSDGWLRMRLNDDGTASIYRTTTTRRDGDGVMTSYVGTSGIASVIWTRNVTGTAFMKAVIYPGSVNGSCSVVFDGYSNYGNNSTSQWFSNGGFRYLGDNPINSVQIYSPVGGAVLTEGQITVRGLLA